MNRPIDELALQYVLHIIELSEWVILDPISKYNNLRSASQNMYEEMCQRIGKENTDILVNKKREILRMLGAYTEDIHTGQ